MAANLAPLQQALGAQGAEVCVVAPAENLRYLLGYDATAVDRVTALVVTPTGAAMILPDFDAAEFSAVAPDIPVAPWSDREGPARAIEQVFALAGSDRPERALVDGELPFAFFVQLRDRLGPNVASASDLLFDLRLRKTDGEIERIAQTGELISRAIDAFPELARPGLSERLVKSKLEAFLWEGGAESVDFVLVQAGANSAAPHHTADTSVLREGEPVLVDIGIRAGGYYADLTQNVFLGDASAEYEEHYDVVGRAQQAGVEAAVAGATAHDVDAATAAVIEGAGLGEWNGPRTGHGLGIGVHEPPSVVRGNHVELAAGTVITVEPGVYIPGKYGIRIEDTVAVTTDGPRRLGRGARPFGWWR
jgi:Xaa-Pro aminopeptidase